MHYLRVLRPEIVRCQLRYLERRVRPFQEARVHGPVSWDRLCGVPSCFQVVDITNRLLYSIYPWLHNTFKDVLAKRLG